MIAGHPACVHAITCSKEVKADASISLRHDRRPEKIDGDDPLLASAARLSSSVDAAKRYHQLLNIIFWKTARPALKKNVPLVEFPGI